MYVEQILNRNDREFQNNNANEREYGTIDIILGVTLIASSIFSNDTWLECCTFESVAFGAYGAYITYSGVTRFIKVHNLTLVDLTTFYRIMRDL